MPEELMWVARGAGTSFSTSRVNANSLSPLLRDNVGNLVGQATMRPASAPQLGVVVGGIALIGLTLSVVAAARSFRSQRASGEMVVEASRSAAPAGWYSDDNGCTRWWDGARWTTFVQAAPSVTTPPAGWYDDGALRMRWWDGTQWTDHSVPRDASQQAAAPGRHPHDGMQHRAVEYAPARITISAEEWRARCRTMLLARALSDEQWRVLAHARIEGAGEQLLAWQAELRLLTPEEFSERVRIAAARADGEAATGISTAPGWYDDDSGQRRWWNGHHWTGHVQELVPAHSRGGSEARAGWYDDQQGRWRWWDGERWTQHYG